MGRQSVARPIEVAAHIVRKSRGLSIYFDLRNLYGCCVAHNAGEHWHPGLYREKHVEIFGKDLVETLERRSHDSVQFTREDYKVMIEEDKKVIAKAK